MSKPVGEQIIDALVKSAYNDAIDDMLNAIKYLGEEHETYRYEEAIRQLRKT